MRTETKKDLKITLLKELEIGQWFYYTGSLLLGGSLPLGGIRRLVGGPKPIVIREDGTKAGTLSVLGYLEVLPVDGPHVTREEAVEAATFEPKLTFGDLEGGDVFTIRRRRTRDEFIKLAATVDNQGLVCTAIWKHDGWPCVIYDYEKVERVEETNNED